MADGGQRLAAPETDRPPPQPVPARRQAANQGSPGLPHDAHGNGAHRDGAQHDGAPHGATGDAAHHDAHPPALPISPINPALGHPANAPLRAAAMAQLQRGVGNRAAQAMVAATMPGGEATADEDTVELSAVPAEEPGAEPPAPQQLDLRAEPIRAAYLAEPALQTSELNFLPARSQGENRSPRQPPPPAVNLAVTAGDLAVRRHAEIRRTGEMLHEAAVMQANRAVEDAVQAYQTAMQRLDSDDAGAARWLDSLAEQQRGELEASVDSALRRLNDAVDIARATVMAAGKEGVRQVDLAAGRAAGGIAAAVASAIKESMAAIDKDRGEFEKASDEASGFWTKLRDHPEADFGGGPMLAAAKNELRRKMVLAQVVPIVKQLTDHKAEELKAYAAWAAARPGQLRHGQTATSLNHANDAFRHDGRRTIEQTQEQALTGIAELARSGRRMLASMRRNALGQLTAQRQAARARLDLMSRGRHASLHAETASSLGALQTGAFSGLALFARAPGSLRTALREAAPRGPDTVLQIARANPPGIETAMANARRLHGDRVAANVAGMRGTAVNHLDQHAAAIGAEQARAQTELAGGVAENALAMTEAAETQARSLATTASKVGEAAQTLVAGFSKAFGAQLGSGTKNLATENKNFAGETPKPGDKAKSAGSATPTNGTAPDQEAPGDKTLLDGKMAGDKPAPGKAGAGQPQRDKADADKAAADKAGGDKAGANDAGAEKATADPNAPDKAAAAGGKKPPEPQTLGQRRAVWEGLFDYFKDEQKKFDDSLKQATDQLEIDLRSRLIKLEGALETKSPSKAAASVRGVTALQGAAIREMHARPLGPELYDITHSFWTLHPFRDDDYYHATMAYLSGHSLRGVRFELQAVKGVFSADFPAVEDIMNSLSAEDRKALAADDEHPGTRPTGGATLADIREHLDGAQLKAFDALAKGQFAKAEAQKRLDEILAARREGNIEALKAAAQKIAGGSEYGAWTPKDHRAEVNAELAQLVPKDPSLPANATDAEKVLSFVTKPMEVFVPNMNPHGGGGGTYHTVELKDDARVLVENSIRGATGKTGEAPIARAVGLHEELNRAGGPRVGELTKLLIDRRLDPIRADLSAEELEKAEKQRDQAIKERDAAIIEFANRYGGAAPGVTLEAAKRYLESQVTAAFKDDETAREFTIQLAEEAHPTPKAAAIGLDWAINHPTTIDSELVHGILSHMSRKEIDDAKVEFWLRTGDNLLDRLGVYGHGSFKGAGLSGDDRLQAERDLLGVPRNQKEDLELRHFSIEQQRKETGRVGKWFAEGGYGDKQMQEIEAEMRSSLGKPVEFDKEGHLLTPGVFEEDSGKLIGGDPVRLKRATELAPLAVENYQGAVDRLADIATSIIAVIGAIAAVVITVVTAGAAGPLVVAALVAGLATMAAKEAIKGGRYGWKEAGLDLGMTAVQMLTAGAGAALGAASRGGMGAIRAAEVAEEAFSKGMLGAEAMEAAAAAAKPGQILGTQIADHALIGATTGAIGGAGQAALSPDIWKEGGAKGAEEVIFGLFRGALSGLVTSLVSQKFEGIGSGKNTIGSMMAGLGKTRNASMIEQMVLRGILKAPSSAIGAMAGRSTEIGFESLTGHFRGNAEDAFGSILEAGWHASLRGFAEGAAEAPAARYLQGKIAAEARQRYGQPAPPARVVTPEAEPPPPRVTAGASEPGEEPHTPRLPVEEPLRRQFPVPEPAEPEAAGGPGVRARPPRAAGEPLETEPAMATVPGRRPEDIQDLPDQTVIRGATPHDIDEARLIYGNAIADTPDREAAIYFNPETGEYIIVQGEATTVAVGASAAGELEAPQPAGVAQRWKEVLDGGDMGRWELVAHFHPADQPGGDTSLPLRLPSGQDGDFATIDAESVLAGDQPRSSRIHYLQNGRYEHTDFGVDPSSASARYWVDYADPVTGARSRETFATIARYHEWFADAFGAPPTAARITAASGGRIAAPAPPRLPEAEPPPQAIRNEIDNLLIGGPEIVHPPAAAVAAAALSFRQGKGTLGDFEVLLKQAAADARLMLSTRRTPLEGAQTDDHAQYVFDVAELSWDCLRGNCGPGRDYMATSLATFLMDAETPLTIRRYQAQTVFGEGKHAFAVVEVPGDPPARYLLDPTFAQFMRPSGNTFALNQATANFLADHPQGTFTARDLLRNGYMPLTEENAALYARAMGVDPAEAAAVGTRLFGTEGAELTERVGGLQRRPPVTRIEGDIETLSAEEVHAFIGERMDRVIVRDGRDEAVHRRLSDFRARAAAAVARGPVFPEQELAEYQARGARPETALEPDDEDLAAAGIPESPTFRALPEARRLPAQELAAVRAELPAALQRLANAGAMPDVRWEPVPSTGLPRIRITRAGTGGEETVIVSFKVGKTRGGEPARFPATPRRNAQGELELTVTISDRHPAAIVEETVSHEITELAYSPRRASAINRLAVGGGRLDPQGPLDQLSGHDRGRLAQIATLARQIAAIEAGAETARQSSMSTDEAEREVRRLRDEAEIRVVDLGLAHGVPVARDARRSLARRALDAEPGAAKLLDESIERAAANPSRQTPAPELDPLTRRIEAVSASDRGNMLEAVYRVAEERYFAMRYGNDPAAAAEVQADAETARRTGAVTTSLPEADRVSLYRAISQDRRGMMNEKTFVTTIREAGLGTERAPVRQIQVTTQFLDDPEKPFQIRPARVQHIGTYDEIQGHLGRTGQGNQPLGPAAFLRNVPETSSDPLVQGARAAEVRVVEASRAPGGYINRSLESALLDLGAQDVATWEAMRRELDAVFPPPAGPKIREPTGLSFPERIGGTGDLSGMAGKGSGRVAQHDAGVRSAPPAEEMTQNRARRLFATAELMRTLNRVGQEELAAGSQAGGALFPVLSSYRAYMKAYFALVEPVPGQDPYDAYQAFAGAREELINALVGLAMNRPR